MPRLLITDDDLHLRKLVLTYAQLEGGIIITVSVTQEQRQCHVSVANPGTPIPKEEQALIWERYQRSQYQGGRRQGTGLGLSIASSILKAHEMSYGVECQSGLTVFWFSAPQYVKEPVPLS